MDDTPTIRTAAPMPRHKTVAVDVGGVTVGGGAPIVVQSMTNTDTADIAATVAQVAALAQTGSEIVRITVDRDEAAKADDDVLEIKLRDDGPGSADYAARSGGRHGVGLANTRERLHVLYGDRQSFTIRTCEPHGTLVTLRLPLERLEEDLVDAPAYADR